jgi:hypothetical protein
MGNLKSFWSNLRVGKCPEAGSEDQRPAPAEWMVELAVRAMRSTLAASPESNIKSPT